MLLFYITDINLMLLLDIVAVDLIDTDTNLMLLHMYMYYEIVQFQVTDTKHLRLLQTWGYYLRLMIPTSYLSTCFFKKAMGILWTPPSACLSIHHAIYS